MVFLASISTSVAAGQYTCSYEFEPESGTDGRNGLPLFFTPQYPLLGRGHGLRGGPESQFLPSPDLTQGASVPHSPQAFTCVIRTEEPHHCDFPPLVLRPSARNQGGKKGFPAHHRHHLAVQWALPFPWACHILPCSGAEQWGRPAAPLECTPLANMGWPLPAKPDWQTGAPRHWLWLKTFVLSRLLSAAPHPGSGLFFPKQGKHSAEQLQLCRALAGRLSSPAPSAAWAMIKGPT